MLNNCRILGKLLTSASTAHLSQRSFQSTRYVQQQCTTPHRKYSKIVHLSLLGSIGTFVIYDGIINDLTISGAIVRFIRSLKAASLIAIDYLLLNESSEDYESKLKIVHQKSADRLLQACLINGGLYIKVGQGVAAINHILPKEYTRTLSKLQDECLPTSQKDVQKVFLKDFGQLPEEIFSEFNYKPIAAASLAQVFQATLKNGDKVAVKVQYNDLKKRFTSDLGTIIFLQNIIEFLFKSYNFGWILKDLRKNLIFELDFVNEGKNAERCAKDLKKFSFVHIPMVHWNYTKTRVLTLEWIDGIKISDNNKIKANKLNIREIDFKLFNIFSEQIFNTGFVHADPHPGNIFVRRNSTSGKVEIILLDHGLYEELPKTVRGPLCDFWEATVLRDEIKMETAAKKLGIKDYIKFAEVLFQQPISIRGRGIHHKLSQEDIDYMQEIARQNFEMIMDTLKEMPRNMLFVVRNLNTVRAIGHHHGDIVDRPRVMARYAQRISKLSNSSAFKLVRWLYHRLYFEYCLWSNSFKLQFINWYFNILYLLGRAPESARTIMRDLTMQPIT